MADSPTRPTPAPWIWELDDDGITDPTAEVFVDDDRPWRIVIAFVAHQPQLEANAALIVAACNACQLVNPEDPQSVANALETIIASADVVLKGFGAHAFVRDTSGDHNSDWAIKLMPYITALARLEVALNQILPSRAALASIETQETP